MTTKINLGDTARDRVSGFKGVCVAITQWISGCARVTLQPPAGKDGKIPDAQTFDEPMLELVKAKTVAMGPTKTGGPRPEPSTAAAPRR